MLFFSLHLNILVFFEDMHSISRDVVLNIFVQIYYFLLIFNSLWYLSGCEKSSVIFDFLTCDIQCIPIHAVASSFSSNVYIFFKFMYRLLHICLSRIDFRFESMLKKCFVVKIKFSAFFANFHSTRYDTK